jgi:predicted phosphoadenosine phosphosulfate sulfurtransferase
MKQWWDEIMKDEEEEKNEEEHSLVAEDDKVPSQSRVCLLILDSDWIFNCNLQCILSFN